MSEPSLLPDDGVGGPEETWDAVLGAAFAPESEPGRVGDIQPDRPLGDFRIIREVGRGGMGVVYEAEQISLGRHVALKVLPFAAALDSKQLQRFKNEAHAAAQLHHTHIVPVYGVGCARGVHFYAMQFIEGHTLSALIYQLRQQAGMDKEDQTQEPQPLTLSKAACESVSGRLPQTPPAVRDGPATVSFANPADRASHPLADTALMEGATALSAERSIKGSAYFRTVANLGIQAAEALEHAHQQGVIHRDIKPANLMVDVHGTLWVTDFGLAHIQSDVKLTMTGDLLGTLRYMSPEQALGQRAPLDHRTDVYSLGVTLYELLTLEAAFKGESRQDVLRQIAFEEPVRPSRLNKAIPGELETIALKAMAKNQAERFATAQDLADDLKRFLEDKPIRAKRPTIRQRLVKWVRRHPSLTGMLVMSAVAAVAVVVMAVLQGALNEAKTQRAIAEKERAKVEKLEALTRQLLYAAQTTSAGRQWADAHLDPIEDLLLRQKPKEGEKDLRGFEWHYLWRLCHSDRFTLREHKHHVRSVAYSPDGKHLASGGYDGCVRIWDVATGRQLHVLSGHKKQVEKVAYSPDGQRIASSGADRTLRIWDVRTGKEVLLLTGHSGTGVIHGGQFSSDGKYLVSAGGASSGDGRNEVKIWDAHSGKELGSYPGRTSGESGVAISPDGRRLASAGPDNVIKIWDPMSGREFLSLPGHGGLLRSITFSPDGQLLASAAVDRTARIWNLGTGKEIHSLKHSGVLNVVVFSPDGRHLATGSEDRLIKFWDVRSGAEIYTIRGHTSNVEALAFSPGGEQLASASWDNTVKVWDLPFGQEARILKSITNTPFCVAFSPDSSLLAAGGLDHMIRTWDVRTGRELHVLRGHTGPVYRVAFSPDGRHVASAGGDGAVKVWQIVNGAQTLTIKGHKGPVLALGYSPDGRLLASAADRVIKIWQPESGKLLKSFPEHKHEIRSIAISRDSKLLAAGGGDSKYLTPAAELKIWDISDLDRVTELWSLSGHSDQISKVAFSPDSQRLASASQDYSVRIWNAATGEPLSCLQGHADNVLSVAFSPDGRRVVSASADGHIKVWDAEIGQETLSLRDEQLAGAHQEVSFSSDGRRLAYTAQGSVKIWDADEPKPLEPETARAIASAWHAQAARESEANGQWYAAAFHLNWLLTGDSQPAAESRIVLPFRLALAHSHLAELAKQEGQYSKAEAHFHKALAHFQKAVELGKRAVASDQKQRDSRKQLAQSYLGLGGLLRDRDRHPEAEKAFHQGRDICRSLVEEAPSVANYGADLAKADENLVALLKKRGLSQDAFMVYRDTIKLYRKVVAGDNTVPDYRDRLARNYHNLGGLLHETGKLLEADKAYRQAISIWDQLASEVKDEFVYRQHAAFVHGQLGNVLSANKQLPEAIEVYRESIKRFAKLAQEFPKNPGYLNEPGHVCWGLGQALAAAGKSQEAALVYQQAIDRYLKLVKDFPDEPYWRQELGWSYWHLAHLLRDSGQLAKAEEPYRLARDVYKELARDYPENAEYRRRLFWGHSHLADFYVRWVKRDKAFAEYSKAIPTSVADRLTLTGAWEVLARLAKETGQPEEAKNFHSRAIEIIEKLAADVLLKPEDQMRLAESCRAMGFSQQGAVRTRLFRQAEKAYRGAVAIYEQLGQKDPANPGYREQAGHSGRFLGWFLRDTGRHSEAVAAFQQALQVFERLTKEYPEQPNYPLHAGDTLVQIGQELKASHRPREAEQVYRRAILSHSELVAKFPQAPEYRPYLDWARYELARFLVENKRPAEAEAEYRKALESAEKAAADFPDNVSLAELIGQRALHLGWHLMSVNRHNDAEKVLQRGAGSCEEAARRLPKAPVLRWYAAYARVNLADAVLAQKRSQEAEDHYQKAVVVLFTLPADFVRAGDRGGHVSNWFSKLIGQFQSAGKNQEAAALLQQIVEFYRRLNGDCPNESAFRAELAKRYMEQSRFLRDVGKFQDAELVLRLLIDLREKLAVESPKTAPPQYDLAFALRERALLLAGPLKKPQEAEELHGRELRIFEKLAVDFPGQPQYVEQAGHTYRYLGFLRWRTRRFRDADQAFTGAVKIFEKLAAELPKVPLYREFLASTHQVLGNVRVADGRPVEAEKSYRQALEVDPKSAVSHNNLAWLLTTCTDAKLRNAAQAVELAKKAVALEPKQGMWWNTLGAAQYRAGDWQAAHDSLNKSMKLRNGGDAFDWFFLAMAHWKLDQKEAARKWYEQALAWTVKNSPKDEELRRFRAEAEELLKIEKKAKPK